MRKKFILIITICLLITGCSSGVQEKVVPAPLEAYEATEPMQESVPNPYQYLYPYTLENEEVRAQVYLPEELESERGESATASRSGITVSVSIQPSDSSLDSISEEKDIKDSGGAVEESTEAGGAVLIKYTIQDDGKVYPCLRILKAEPLSETYQLSVTIDINNELAVDDSSAILSETADAYGISLQ